MPFSVTIRVIGMMQHANLRTAGEVHGLSRNLVYQAIVGQ